ncbi:MAG: hypothetical protein KDE31_11350 [Caldilineaceae bacterium]|nr:hypothetical protein [Caldilineaceae bacterium]
MTIQIIGAGLGRTGTSSLKVALERLGYEPCFHMSEFFQNPQNGQRWQAVDTGKSVDWPAVFEGYQATVDFPSCLFYKELLAAYPDAKVVLTVRNPERWYESTYETVYQLSQLMPRWLSWRQPFGVVRRLLKLYWGGLFEGRFEERDHAIERFKAWNAEVQATVPADKLLVFEVKEGWEPLCNFLGVPVPDEPFPHVNDRAEMLTRVSRLRAVQRWTPPVVGTIITLLIVIILWRSMK